MREADIRSGSVAPEAVATSHADFDAEARRNPNAAPREINRDLRKMRPRRQTALQMSPVVG